VGAIRTLSLAAASAVLAACAARAPAPVVAPPPPPATSSPAAPGEELPLWDARGPAPRRGLPAHVALGVPRDADPSDDYLMDKDAYVVSYNPRLNAPNWVAWRVTKGDLGDAPRSRGFHADDALPAPFYRVRDDDYRGSGFDRGHLCPSADRSASPGANGATFLFTNVHPQQHDMNAGPWEKLEAHERELARAGEDVYVVAGGVFAAEPPRIGRGVAVPDASYKVLVALPRGATVRDVDARARAFAVVVPNRAGIARDPWTKYATTVRAVEGTTGYDYLTRLPRAVQDALERAPPPS
jgi:endonuclease G